MARWWGLVVVVALGLAACGTTTVGTVGGSTGSPTAIATAPQVTGTVATATASPLPAPVVPSPSHGSAPRPSPPARSPSPSARPSAPAPSPTTTIVASGSLRGTVTAGPTCPVENLYSPCPPRPVAGATVSASDASNAVRGTTTTAPDGSYTMALPPGTYQVSVATGSMFPRCSPVPATVVLNQVTAADVACDTGIR